MVPQTTHPSATLYLVGCGTGNVYPGLCRVVPKDGDSLAPTFKPQGVRKADVVIKGEGKQMW